MENGEGRPTTKTGIRRIEPIPERSGQAAPQPSNESPGADFYARQRKALDEERIIASGVHHISEVEVATSDSHAPDLSPKGRKEALKKMADRWTR